MTIMIVNAATGEVIERDFTPEELAQREADATAAVQAEADRVQALGLTLDEIATIVP
jgi:hypothetical protein